MGIIESSVILQKKFVLKCHVRIQKRLSGERAIIGPTVDYAIEMAFRWPADCGPTLNADSVALRVLVGSEPVLLRNPIVL